jgi:hypothetical protein
MGAAPGKRKNKTNMVRFLIIPLNFAQVTLIHNKKPANAGLHLPV